MQKPTLGWQSWSPPYPKWHGLPRWDYSPFQQVFDQSELKSSRTLNSKILYWCSWYAHGKNISDHVINNTIQVITKNKLPLTHIIIDDGWTNWGDWIQPNLSKFHNLHKTVSDIHRSGLKAGLWFAPFLVDPKSNIYHNHPDWLVKKNNRLIQGFKTVPVWESLLTPRYLLDFSQPTVINYIKQCLHIAIKEWRVDLLKLDFLYAPYFDLNHKSPTIATRHLQWLLKYIKNTYPKVQTIACGAPFKESSYLTDAIRISKDTALPPTVPHFFNSLVYKSRIEMLKTTLDTDLPPRLNVDPDVRMFYLDNIKTSEFWDTIQTPIIGIGDNLHNLTISQITKVKIWLKNHSSQS